MSGYCRWHFYASSNKIMIFKKWCPISIIGMHVQIHITASYNRDITLAFCLQSNRQRTCIPCQHKKRVVVLARSKSVVAAIEHLKVPCTTINGWIEKGYFQQEYTKRGHRRGQERPLAYDNLKSLTSHYCDSYDNGMVRIAISSDTNYKGFCTL